MLRLADAAPFITHIYDRWRRLTPGAQVRPHLVRDRLLADFEYERDGGTSLFALVHDDGYVLYRRMLGGGAMDVRVREIRTVTDDAHVALGGPCLDWT